MISKGVVYKIRYVTLRKANRVSKKSVTGCGVNCTRGACCFKPPKRKEPSAAFTSKELVNKLFTNIRKLKKYGQDFKCEIVTFQLDEISKSEQLIP